jgi:hypothetical protein
VYPDAGLVAKPLREQTQPFLPAAAVPFLENHPINNPGTYDYHQKQIAEIQPNVCHIFVPVVYWYNSGYCKG